jgi:cell division protein FtsN
MQINKNSNEQRGGTLMGVVVGVLVGLGLALGVALYIMKVPTPFNNKNASRTPAQDVAESRKNKDWDPNAVLSGKPVKSPTTDSSAPLASQPTPDKPNQPSAPTPAAANPAVASPAATTPTPAATAGDGVVEFYVQVGAFRSDADAQALRGKLALSNFEGKIVEREQAGQKVFRVRVGPYANQAAGDKAKVSLEAAGFDTVVVRSQR